MPKTFTELTNQTETGRKSAVRALQAWQYLIARASNRQIIRYEDLRHVMGYPDDRPLFTILGYVMYLCSQWKLPPLTVIVVNSDGTPGPGFTEIPRSEFDRKREDVFAYPWYEVVPPSIDDFANAYGGRDGGVANV